MHRIHKISLQNFRNFSQTQIALNRGVHLIIGDNGVGKTNFLEAIHLICLCKSFRTNSDKDLLKHQENFFFVHAEIANHTDFQSVDCNFLINKGKKIFHDKQALDKFSEHIGKLPCVCLIPEDSELVKEVTKRRKWLNQFISQNEKTYLMALQKYDYALIQRNAALKNNSSTKELEPWTYQLIQNGKIIYEFRQIYLEKIQTTLKSIYQFLQSAEEIPEIQYVPNYRYSELDKDMAHYEKNLEKDCLLGYTNIGIHKDDILFSINRFLLKTFGSQGQQKTFVIGLKLAEYLEIKKKTVNDPILLLDDIFEKLDRTRIQAISEFLFAQNKGQIFISHPNNELINTSFGKKSSLLSIENGVFL